MYVCEREKREGGGEEEEESRVRVALSYCHIVCNWVIFDRDLRTCWLSHWLLGLWASHWISFVTGGMIIYHALLRHWHFYVPWIKRTPLWARSFKFRYSLVTTTTTKPSAVFLMWLALEAAWGPLSPRLTSFLCRERHYLLCILQSFLF